ncbi:hypothetical protein NUU61_000873 [Penicillium alfredii]|uniref:Uncharacterized protein n=1 Tax=Penicillium alfredii TaxID=1506179 RepID=A0A9W9GAV7_9EURO|nr:uncharacterized protein NUU61_000873 [Penicillium alfredii]KAJ5115114.1 hypothetical protein NUU61_000873 [Penicillium alfredii]
MPSFGSVSMILVQSSRAPKAISAMQLFNLDPVCLEWCINVVGALEDSSRGHFRHTGLSIEDSDDWHSPVAVIVLIFPPSSLTRNP